MTSSSRRSLNQAEQIERFLETARSLGCDQDKEKFEAALAKIAAHKPVRASKRKAKVEKAK